MVILWCVDIMSFCLGYGCVLLYFYVAQTSSCRWNVPVFESMDVLHIPGSSLEINPIMTFLFELISQFGRSRDPPQAVKMDSREF
jgi:hypothetical protein